MRGEAGSGSKADVTLEQSRSVDEGPNQDGESLIPSPTLIDHTADSLLAIVLMGP